MPVRSIWTWVVGVALRADGASLRSKKWKHLASRFLGMMFFLFGCRNCLPCLLTRLDTRRTGTLALRDIAYVDSALFVSGASTLHERPEGQQTASGTT